jgi:polysaccharide biosynthesis protein PslH
MTDGVLARDLAQARPRRGAQSRTPRTEVLFLTRRTPYPLDNGARIRAHRLLAGLASSFRTTLLTYSPGRGSPDGALARAELKRALPDVEVITVPGLDGRKRVAQATSLMSSRSWEFGRYRTHAFGTQLRSLLVERQPAIVHFDDLGVAGFLPAAGPLNVFAPHNVEHRILAGNARTAHGPRRLFSALEARKVAREEQRAWRDADLVLAVSQPDASVMRRGGAGDLELCPNGTERVAQLPAPHRLPGEPLRLLFVGSCSYRPYEVGLSWFVKQVYGPVAREQPISFDVVGEPPLRPVHAPGVVYHGRVPSLRPFYARAHVVVVPVFAGSGTRLKIVEAMAHGRPVVSTELGAEGLPIAPGEHYLAAEDAAAFIAELRRLAATLEHPQELEAMLRRAREAMEPLFWDVIEARLVELYRYWIERVRYQRAHAAPA